MAYGKKLINKINDFRLRTTPSAGIAAFATRAGYELVAEEYDAAVSGAK